MQAAERDYDLNRAAELKYGTLLELQKQLKEAEAALETASKSQVRAAAGRARSACRQRGARGRGLLSFGDGRRAAG